MGAKVQSPKSGMWKLRRKLRRSTLRSHGEQGPSGAAFDRTSWDDLGEVAFRLEPQLPHLSIGDEKTCSDWLAEGRSDVNIL